MVLDIIARLRGDFAIADIQERCPGKDIDMLRRILHQKRDGGRLECLGRGPNARWRRIGQLHIKYVMNDSPIHISPNLIGQKLDKSGKPTKKGFQAET